MGAEHSGEVNNAVCAAQWLEVAKHIAPSIAVTDLNVMTPALRFTYYRLSDETGSTRYRDAHT
jgi:spore coat protein CotF